MSYKFISCIIFLSLMPLVAMASFEQCVQASQAVMITRHDAYQQASKKLALLLKQYQQNGGDSNKLTSVQKFVDLCNSSRMKHLFAELKYDEKTICSLLMLFTFTGHAAEVRSCIQSGAQPLYKSTNGLTALDIAIVRLATVYWQNDRHVMIEVLQELLVGLPNHTKVAYCVKSLQKLRSNQDLVASITQGFMILDVMSCLDSRFERQLITLIAS